MLPPNPNNYDSDWDYYEAKEAYRKKINQDEWGEEWEEWCDEVIIPHASVRPYEDQTWIYGRKDV